MSFTVTAVAVVTTAACVPDGRGALPVPTPRAAASPSAASPGALSPGVAAASDFRPLFPGGGPSAASQRLFPVGVRELRLARGAARPLRTLLLYPRAAATPADTGNRPQRNARPAHGRFPIVLFSHGLHGSPERYTPAAAVWASAGFVVALPAYPHTNRNTPRYRRADIVHQPADAAYVIDRIRRLDTLPGDPLHGRIDGDRVAAVGHSAGGYTTTGLFHAGHDARIRAGVVLAGWPAPGAFAGPGASMLFVHGDADPVVPLALGRAAYARVPWPRSFVVLSGASHAQYLRPGRPGFDHVIPLVTDFLRWNLYADAGAGRRLPPTDVPVSPAG